MAPTNITGYLIPIGRDGCPVLLSFRNTTDKFVPVFSTLDKIEALRCACELPPNAGVRTIEDSGMFLASLRGDDDLPFKLRVAIDPYRHTACGNIHFDELPLDAEELYS